MNTTKKTHRKSNFSLNSVGTLKEVLSGFRETTVHFVHSVRSPRHLYPTPLYNTEVRTIRRRKGKIVTQWFKTRKNGTLVHDMFRLKCLRRRKSIEPDIRTVPPNILYRELGIQKSSHHRAYPAYDPEIKKN